MDIKMKSLLYTSISDFNTVDRIFTCLFKSKVSLYIIFNGKYIYDKYTSKHSSNDSYLFFICSVIISSKIYMDSSFTNESWTEISHIPVIYINRVEKRILEGIDYDIILHYKSLEMMYIEYGYVPLPTYEKKIKKKKGFRHFLKLFLCL